MKRFLLSSLLLVLVLDVVSVAAQAPAESGRLTYRFKRPTKTALEIARAGLPSFDGELVSIQQRQGDSVAQIIARVRPESWAENPEVWGQLPDGAPQVFFGRLQEYLAGDPRFRILVHPSYCAHCEGDLEAVFLRYADTTGYLVGGGRPGAVTSWPLVPLGSRSAPRLPNQCRPPIETDPDKTRPRAGNDQLTVGSELLGPRLRQLQRPARRPLSRQRAHQFPTGNRLSRPSLPTGHL
jgi:hypothetical protein